MKRISFPIASALLAVLLLASCSGMDGPTARPKTAAARARGGQGSRIGLNLVRRGGPAPQPGMNLRLNIEELRSAKPSVGDSEDRYALKLHRLDV